MEEVKFDRTYFRMGNNDQIAQALEFMRAALTGTAYVRLIGSARDGTIAIADFSEFNGLKSPQEWKDICAAPFPRGISEYEHRNIERVRRHHTYDSYIKDNTYYAKNFQLRFDGSAKLIKPAEMDYDTIGFVWLKDYVGPTVKQFTKNDRDKTVIPVFDTLRGEVKVGDFIATVKSNTLYIGKVIRLTPSGKSVGIIPLMGSKELVVPAGNNVVIIDDQTKNRAMLLKLAR